MVINPNLLIGRWHLKEFFRQTGNDAEEALEGKLSGSLEYMGSGRMKAHLTHVPPEDSGDEGFDTWYEGTYFFENDHTVIHTVDKASEPERLGKDLLRNFNLLDDKQLVITGENPRSRFRIVWLKEM